MYTVKINNRVYSLNATELERAMVTSDAYIEVINYTGRI